MVRTTGMVHGTISANQWGGWYESGRSYQLRDKVRVARVYNVHCGLVFPKDPSLLQIAKQARVSRTFAAKVIRELEDGGLVDPEFKNAVTRQSTGVARFLWPVGRDFTTTTTSTRRRR